MAACSIVGCSFFLGLQPNDLPCKLRFKTNKECYSPGEPIWIGLTVENTGFDLLDLPGPIPGGGKFEILLESAGDNSGNVRFPFHPSSEAIDYPKQIFLDSYKSKEFHFNLLDYFGVELKNPFSSCRFLLDISDNYHVRVKFTFKHEDQNIELLSKPAAFRIEGFQDEKIELFETLESGRKLLAEGREYGAIEQFRILADKRDKGRCYSDLAGYYVVVLLSQLDEDPLSYHQKFVETFPNSNYCREILYSLASELSDRDRKKYFPHLMALQKGTFLAELIEKEYGPFEDDFAR